MISLYTVYRPVGKRALTRLKDRGVGGVLLVRDAGGMHKKKEIK
jgi:hypothetical protein